MNSLVKFELLFIEYLYCFLNIYLLDKLFDLEYVETDNVMYDTVVAYVTLIVT